MLATRLAAPLGPLPAHAAAVPLAVGSLYASANDRAVDGTHRLAHVALPAVCGGAGAVVGAALPGRAPGVVVLVVTLLGAAAGLLSRSGPTGSAAGLQLLALTALGQGLPAQHGAWWLPGILVVLGASLVAGCVAVAVSRSPAPQRIPRAVPTVDRGLVALRSPVSPLRLAACAAVASGADELLHPTRGYWVLLTVALVVKPDLAPVTRRAAHRAAGTVVGLLVAAAVVLVPSPGPLGLAVVAVAATAAVPWAAARSYGTLTAVVLPVVIALLALGGVSGPGLLLWRVVDTAAGLAVAVLVGHTRP